MLNPYSGYGVVDPTPPVPEPTAAPAPVVEFSFTAELDDKDVRLLGDAVLEMIGQFTGSASPLDYMVTPEPQTYPSPVEMTFVAKATALTEPKIITSRAVPMAAQVAGEEVLDAMFLLLEAWIRANDEVLRDLGITESNHRIDMGSIALLPREGDLFSGQVTIYPPVGTIAQVPGVTEGVPLPGAAAAAAEERPKWFIPVGIGAGVLSIAGVIGAVVWSRKR
jgi:hypothetical protein